MRENLTIVPCAGQQPEVLLIASIDAIGITRLSEIFDRAGYRVSVMSRAGNAILRSRYVHTVILVPGGPAETASALFGRLDELRAHYQWLLPCDEPLLEAIAAHANAAEITTALGYLPSADALDEVLSKIVFLKHARGVGLPVPDFEICRSVNEGLAAGLRFGYPVVLKRARSMAGSGVRLIEGESGMRHELEAPDSGEFLVQRFVRGRIGATTILMEHGIPVRYFSFYKLFNWPNAFAPCGGGALTENTQIDALVEKIGELERFHGFCSLDWMEEEGTGKIYLIEFNPRCTPTASKSTWAGSDFISALAGMHTQRPPAPQIRPHLHAGQVFHMFPETTFYAIDEHNPRLFLRSLRSAPMHDPGLLLAHIWRIVGHYVPENWKSKLAWAIGKTERRRRTEPPRVASVERRAKAEERAA